MHNVSINSRYRISMYMCWTKWIKDIYTCGGTTWGLTSLLELIFGRWRDFDKPSKSLKEFLPTGPWSCSMDSFTDKKTYLSVSLRKEFVTVAYESCEKIFNKLGFRIQKFDRALGFRAWRNFHTTFNHLLMNFTDLWYHFHHTTIRKLCQKIMTGLLYYESNENSPLPNDTPPNWSSGKPQKIDRSVVFFQLEHAKQYIRWNYSFRNTFSCSMYSITVEFIYLWRWHSQFWWPISSLV